jgi:hypothetical protein
VRAKYNKSKSKYQVLLLKTIFLTIRAVLLSAVRAVWSIRAVNSE